MRTSRHIAAAVAAAFVQILLPIPQARAAIVSVTIPVTGWQVGSGATEISGAGSVNPVRGTGAANSDKAGESHPPITIHYFRPASQPFSISAPPTPLRLIPNALDGQPTD